MRKAIHSSKGPTEMDTDLSFDLRRRFRDAMANLPAAVNIVTTAGPAGRCGITASAVCSVSDTPPTLLFCINRNSTAVAAFADNKRICINVLPGDHEQLALHFAGVTKLSMEERFAEAAWSDGWGELPRLEPALVSLAGRLVEVAQVGSHDVMFVEIDDIAMRADADALIYFDRQFRRISRQPDVATA